MVMENNPSSFLTEVENQDAKIISSLDEISNSRLPVYYNDPEKGFTMDIMMMLDKEKVSKLRQEFQDKESGLSCQDFVHVLMRFLKRSRCSDEHNSSLLHLLSEEQLISNLCELFMQIDVNGDGTMEWEEFTSFIVDTGLTAKNHQPNAIQLYHHVSKWEDSSKHSTYIDKIYYFQGNDQIAIAENGSNVLKLYNPDCEFVRSIPSPEGSVLCADYVDKLNQYVMSSSSLQFTFHDEYTSRIVKSCHTPTSQTCLSWFPQANSLFSAGVSGIIYAWDIDRMEEKLHMGGVGSDGKYILKSHEDVVLDLLNLPRLESLASCSMDKSIRLWDINTGKQKQSLIGHTKGVRSLTYCEDYRFLVSAGFDYDAYVWNPYVNNLILRLHGHTSPLCNVQIIPGTPQIITADSEGIFKVWDIRNFSCMQTFTAESKNLSNTRNFVTAFPHKRIIAAGKKLTKFDYEKLENPELTDDLPVFAAIYNPTSMTIITAAGRNVKIWDARFGKLIRVYRSISASDLTALCLDYRERKFIAGDHEGNIQVFDYLNGAHMKDFRYIEAKNKAHLKEVSKIVYCVEHVAIISASWDSTISIHDESDPERGILLRTMKGGHNGDITSLDYSYNLSLIATGSSDNSLQIWDFEFGRLEGSCVGHCSGITAVQFLDPYPLLLSADAYGNICIWAMRPSSFKYNCVMRIKNRRAKGNCSDLYSSVLTFSLHKSIIQNNDNIFVKEFVLFTGDEKGVISSWDMLPLLNHLSTNKKYSAYNLAVITKPYECTNPHRNIRINAKDQIRNSCGAYSSNNKSDCCARDQTDNFFFNPGSPLVNGKSSSCEKMHFQPSISWKAHEDAVYSLQIINDPEALLTSSFDRMVKLWNFSGECLGVLSQGDMIIPRKKWNFKVDFDKRERLKQETAKSMMAKSSELTAGQRAATASKIAEGIMPEGRTRKKSPIIVSKGDETAILDALKSPTVRLPVLTLSKNGRNNSRKTPRMRPINRLNAGKGMAHSPRLRMQNLMIHTPKPPPSQKLDH